MRLFADKTQGMRFVFVGLAVASLYVVLYALLESLGVPHATANVVAFLSAILFQYAAQTLWTFKKRLDERGQWLRFIVMISVGLVFSTWVTSSAAPNLGLKPLIAAGIVAVSLPAINFILMRFWVYKPPTYKEPK